MPPRSFPRCKPPPAANGHRRAAPRLGPPPRLANHTRPNAAALGLPPPPPWWNRRVCRLVDTTPHGLAHRERLCCRLAMKSGLLGGTGGGAERAAMLSPPRPPLPPPSPCTWPLWSACTIRVSPWELQLAWPTLAPTLPYTRPTRDARITCMCISLTPCSLYALAARSFASRSPAC